MKTVFRALVLTVGCTLTHAADIRDADYGARLPGGGGVALWTAESGWKIGRTKSVSTNSTDAIVIRCARNEAEAAQLVVTPRMPLQGFTVTAGELRSVDGVVLPAAQVEILRVGYVNVTQATDKFGGTGPWPDPLPQIRGPLELAADVNQPFWIRVGVPADAKAGRYSGTIRLAAGPWHAEVPLRVEVFNFALPDKLTCETAFGFSADRAFRYHGARTVEQKRQVLEGYWRSFAAHRISPYDPAPLDPIRVTWPRVKPPAGDWQGGRVVTNEAHGGAGSLAIFDDRKDSVVNAYYAPLLPIPAKGLKLRFACRTALPGHPFLVSLGHFDAQTNWISGHNNDMTFAGDGRWQAFERDIASFPANARFVQLRLYATTYTDEGEHTGLAWFDDVHLNPLGAGAVPSPGGGDGSVAATEELVKGGDFEPRNTKRELVAPREQLEPKLDFTAWDREMERVISTHHFSSFRLHLEGMGGGTYEGHSRAALLGFTEDDPEYEILFGSYVKQLTDHLRAKGWLGMAYTYWFDEPEPSQYDFVRGGFEKLKRLAPGLRGMLTEQVEAGLVGGPSLWCPVSHEYDHERAETRRRAGEHFWWYVCCVPKGPHATEFTDHPGTALRAWLWQTWQRRIEGILIWDSNYWTSPAAYPDRPQNPYEDPMCWVSSGKPGAKHPWGNGDGRFLYPPEAAAAGQPASFVADAPVDSIRWEMLRDGLEDYEYLALLRRRLTDGAAKPGDARRAEWQRLLDVPPEVSADIKVFTHSPAPIEKRRAAVALAIEALN